MTVLAPAAPTAAPAPAAMPFQLNAGVTPLARPTPAAMPTRQHPRMAARLMAGQPYVRTPTVVLALDEADAQVLLRAARSAGAPSALLHYLEAKIARACA